MIHSMYKFFDFLYISKKLSAKICIICVYLRPNYPLPWNQIILAD